MIPAREGKLISGVRKELGGDEYIIPALNLRSVREMHDEIQSLRVVTGLPSDDQIQTMTKIIHAALIRNYPTATLAQVEVMVDLGNVLDVVGAVLGESGFKETQAGEVKTSQ